MRRRWGLLVAMWLLPVVPATAGTVLYVDRAAIPGGDGVAWATAFVFLTDAIDAAEAISGAVEIRIAAGVYPPDRDASNPAGTGERDATFVAATGVAWRGGFAGQAAPDPDERDPVRYPTILSGDLAGDDGPGFAGRAENARHVVTAIDVDASALLDGLTITGGHADGDDLDATGAGLLLVAASPTVVGCVITDNLAAFQGGGLQAKEGSRPRFSACVFTNNRALDNGGAVYNGASPADFIDCLFVANTAAVYAGAVCNRDESDGRFERCTFDGNTAAEAEATGGGGGAMVNARSHPTLIECVFSGNHAPFGRGGALVNEPGHDPALGGSHPEVSGTSFAGNSAQRGGAAYWLESGGPVTDSTFVGNTAFFDDRGGGGAVYNVRSAPVFTGCRFERNASDLGGGLYNLDESHPPVVACVFVGNWAAVAGGLYSDVCSNPLIASCVFVGNRADAEGGAVNSYYSEAIVAGCSFVANRAATGGALFGLHSRVTVSNCLVWDNGVEPIVDGTESATTVTACVVQGGWSGPGQGVVDVDPRVVRSPDPGADGRWGTADDDEGDLRLQPDSPAIDAGENPHMPAGVSIDADGAARFVDDPATIDTGVGPPPIVDMGAYEFPGRSCPADLDGSGDVGFGDLLAVLASWGPCVACGADLDGDGHVGFADLLTTLAAWGPCVP
ncbi:MAG: right-handed parallel beta-helix repeat-containing protein [Phycisphaerales bacterium]|nr:right-handed parallel beta-helix repeat-containing protein [Phycisphaerales bacterium]